MTKPIILGVDPGAAATGYVIRQAGALVQHGIWRRTDDEPIKDYALEVAWSVGDLANDIALGRVYDLDASDGVYVGVEDLNPPTPHLGTIAVLGPMETAVVFGAIIATYPDCVVVEPAKHGTNPRQAYPDALWGPREGTAGRGILRHCRSAWDVAGAVPRLLRIQKLATPGDDGRSALGVAPTKQGAGA